MEIVDDLAFYNHPEQNIVSNFREMKSLILESPSLKKSFVETKEFDVVVRFILNQNTEDQSSSELSEDDNLITSLNIMSILAKSGSFNNDTRDFSSIFQKVLKFLVNLNFDNSPTKNKILEHISLIIKHLCFQEERNIETVHNSGLLCILDKYLKSDISCKHICELVVLFSGHSYYKYHLLKTTNLILKLLTKLISTPSNQLINYILSALSNLLNDDLIYEQQIDIPRGVIEKLESIIKFHKDEDKLLAISIIVKIFSSSKNFKLSNNNSPNPNNNIGMGFSTLGSKSLETYQNKIYCSSVYILLDMYTKLNEITVNMEFGSIIEKYSSCLNSGYVEKNCPLDKAIKLLKMKISICYCLAKLMNKKKDIQALFCNLDGIGLVFKEFKATYTETGIKEADEFMKGLKQKNKKDRPKYKSIQISTKESIDEKSEGIQFNKIVMSSDPTSNPFNLFGNSILEKNHVSSDSLEELVHKYKIALTCLLSFCSSENDDSRKKIIESKELHLALFVGEEKKLFSIINQGFLLLSLGRVNPTTKKLLFEYDVNSIIYKMICHSEMVVQIIGISSLCNYLLDSTYLEKEEIEYIIELLTSVMNDKKLPKFLFYSIYAFKNLAYTHCDNKETVKVLVKKIGFDRLLENLDEEDYSIQEQGLILLRCILHKATTSDEIASSQIRCGKIVKKIVEMVKFYIEKTGVGAVISGFNEKEFASKDDSLVHKHKESCLSNIGICIYVLMNMYVIGDKHKKLVKDSGIMNLIGCLLKYNDKKLNISCLHFVFNSIRTDKKLIIDLNLAPIIESISVMGEDSSEVVKLSSEILQELKKPIA